MDTIPPQLLRAALALPEAARLDLAAELLASVEPPADEGYDAAWDAEIKRRVEQFESGAVKGVPWEVVRESLLREGRDERGAHPLPNPPLKGEGAGWMI